MKISARVDGCLLYATMLNVLLLVLFSSHKALSSVVTKTPRPGFEPITIENEGFNGEEGDELDDADSNTARWLAQLEEAHREISAIKPVSHCLSLRIYIKISEMISLSWVGDVRALDA